jgi:hypothetical protein
VSAEIIELLTRVAELDRKLDSMFRHGPMHERKKIEKRWFVRLKIGGTSGVSSSNGQSNGLHLRPATGRTNSFERLLSDVSYLQFPNHLSNQATPPR